MNEFLKDKIGELLQEALKRLGKDFLVGPQDAVLQSIECKVEYPSEASHGDYASGVALKLAKQIGKNPREVAQKMAEAIALPKWISKVEIAGAGFINFFLAPEFLMEFLEKVVQGGADFGTSAVAKGKTILTDTSHPNVAKPMGVHHLLSTIIGNALNRIFAAVGYKVVRDNYIGDWGTQFGKLIWAYKKWGDEVIVKKNPIPELLKLYVQFHNEAEKAPELEDLGRAEFKKLEDGDKESRKLWKWIVDLSLAEFQKIYDRLDVSFDVIHGESFYEDKMHALIDTGMKKGLFVKGERGALIAPLENPKMPPCIIRKSDGATTYATRDLARVKYWEDTWHPALMIMVVDTAQMLHFQQFFEVAAKLDLTRAPNIHVAFGRMNFPEKRMSTRKGDIILLEDLLDEAEERAYKIVTEKNPELVEAEKKKVARMVGIGAVKYAVLSQNRLTDVTFSWEKILSLDGNSAPYLQYVFARARAILRREKSQGTKNEEQEKLPNKAAGKGGGYIFKEAQELAVARLLPKFPEVIAHAAQEFKPNLIANFLFDLAGRFNSFYAALQVLKAEDSAVREARLKLVEAVAVTIKNGLNLLGIEAPEEM